VDLDDEFTVFFSCFSGFDPSLFFFGLENFFSGESDIGDESLDFGSLLSRFSVGGSPGPPDYIFLEEGGVFFFGEAEELSDFVGSLGPKSSGALDVGESFEVSVSLFHYLEGQDTDIGSHDASSDRLSLPLSGPPGSVALLVFVEEESDSSLHQDALSHGEPVLIVSSGDLHHVSLEFLSEVVTLDFLAHSPVEKNVIFLVVINIVGFLCSSEGI